ncbi:hypothetical protein AKJ54_00140 [candidate division MSBL1 archaeon SCGC-AAA382K21]|uniref:EamA domain-containing protein n=1 Tax=candidate division MSBL1 archaeon SCGC-AAA382K21 TaxID=1698283 RepID=A0A133VM48_9EURY|nr:hypothetical protein AKJ54_00140 [candidate division MSBL1 archaeon SCGC-AAA382K21]
MALFPDLVGAVLAIASALFFAINILLIREATVTGNPLLGVITSLWITVFVFLPASIFIYFPNFGISTESFLAFASAGVLGSILGRACYYTGTKRVGASRSEPITRASLLVSTVYGIIVLGESPTLGHITGIILVAVGVIAVGYEISGGRSGVTSGSRRSFDFLLPVGAMFFFGLADPLIKTGLNGGAPIPIGISIMFSTALAVLAGYLLLNGKSPVYSFQAKERIYYIGAGVAVTIAMGLQFLALEISRVVVVTPLKSFAPIFVLLLSYFFLRRLERITKLLILGSIFVVCGAFLIGVFM